VQDLNQCQAHVLRLHLNRLHALAHAPSGCLLTHVGLAGIIFKLRLLEDFMRKSAWRRVVQDPCNALPTYWLLHKLTYPLPYEALPFFARH